MVHVNQALWDRLRGAKRSFPHHLQSVRIRNFRMFKDLQVELPFPVAVIAGANGSGKTSLLLSLAMGYGWETARGFKSKHHPKRLFPEYSGADDAFADDPGHPEFTYTHVTRSSTFQCFVDRPRVNWRASFKSIGRPIHIQSLFSLSDHTSRNNVNQFCKRLNFDSEIPADYLKLLSDMLPPPISYDAIRIYTNLNQQRFAVARRGTAAYSEFNMAAGERIVLHLVDQLRDPALDGALVLIDELETALHPSLQRIVMRYLLDLSLRRQMQIVVTSHSEEVIDSVPEEARVFLSYDPDRGAQQVAVRDIIERALYGQARRKLKIICEDEIAKQVLTSFLAPIFVDERLDFAQIDVGHDTGKDEFPAHVRALDLVGVLSDCVFVLDGDAGAVRDKILTAATANQRSAPAILLLPGARGPEAWLWSAVRAAPERLAQQLRLDPALLAQVVADTAALFAAARKSADDDKVIWTSLAERLRLAPTDLARDVARVVAEDPDHPAAAACAPFRGALRDAVRAWRSRS